MGNNTSYANCKLPHDLSDYLKAGTQKILQFLDNRTLYQHIIIVLKKYILKNKLNLEFLFLNICKNNFVKHCSQYLLAVLTSIKKKKDISINYPNVPVFRSKRVSNILYYSIIFFILFKILNTVIPIFCFKKISDTKNCKSLMIGYFIILKI